MDWFTQTVGVTDYLQLNGDPIDVPDPVLLRATSYGHFTSMQVHAGRDYAVRGALGVSGPDHQGLRSHPPATDLAVAATATVATA